MYQAQFQAFITSLNDLQQGSGGVRRSAPRHSKGVAAHFLHGQLHQCITYQTLHQTTPILFNSHKKKLCLYVSQTFPNPHRQTGVSLLFYILFLNFLTINISNQLNLSLLNSEQKLGNIILSSCQRVCSNSLKMDSTATKS